MNTGALPRLIPVDALEPLLTGPELLILDLGSEQNYHGGHLPGAVHLPAAMLVDGGPPVPGRLPDPGRLASLFGMLGLTPETHVVAYDDEGGGWAGRLIWTLEVVGHTRWSYLDGGIHAWRAAGLPVQHLPAAPPASIPFQSCWNASPRATAADIMASLDDDNFLAWDARSWQEYTGESARARRGGHIPGAVHCEWTELMDSDRHLRLRPETQLREILAGRGLTPERDIVTYCQTHHRSGLTWLVGRLLGFPRIRAYDGSWSEWGNRDDTPVTTGDK